jgi:hypothetical protein
MTLTELQRNWLFYRIPGETSKDDCEWLASLAAKVSSWTEIGVYAGRSMLAVALALPPHSLLQLVDIKFHPQFQRSRHILSIQRPDLKVVVSECSSPLAALTLRDTDVVFVDGDHSYQGVCDDIKAWGQKCRILCGHDYLQKFPGVVQAVTELIPHFTIHSESIWMRTAEAA